MQECSKAPPAAAAPRRRAANGAPVGRPEADRVDRGALLAAQKALERHAGDGGEARARWQFHGGRQGITFAAVAPLVGYVDRRDLWAERRA